jgi:hypothetical protein
MNKQQQQEYLQKHDEAMLDKEFARLPFEEREAYVQNVIRQNTDEQVRIAAARQTGREYITQAEFRRHRHAYNLGLAHGFIWGVSLMAAIIVVSLIVIEFYAQG